MSTRSPWFYVFIAWIAALATGAFVVGAMREGEDFLIPAIIAMAVIAVVVIKSPIGNALAARLRGDVTPHGLDEAVLAELDDVRARMAELEERLDFSERLMAQTGEAARIAAPGREVER